MLKTSFQNRLLNSLPDDRPITSLQIIESLDKCPKGFYPISRTYDQDQDADLRESSIFKISPPRYLCLSKTEGLPNFVVKDLAILNDKFNPPKSYSILNRTADSAQKAWKKKQLCYHLVNRKDTKIAITDIIICSRLKKAPEGFQFAGELNGVTICFKMGNVQDTQSQSNQDLNQRNSIPQRPMYPSLNNDSGGDHDYEILRPDFPSPGPLRPAPKPPATIPQQNSTTNTYGGGGAGGGSFHVLDGVPFIVNPKFLPSSNADKFQLPVIKAKTMQQIMKEYDYPFTVERQT